MTTISEKLTTINNTLKAIKQAIINKGVTPSGNITTYATAIENIPTGGGGSSFQLTRFSDDTGTEIGTHYMNFTDANDNTFKVIVLDCPYRTRGTNLWLSSSERVTNLPLYYRTYSLWWYDNAKETATENCNLIKAFCDANNYTSDAVNFCRNKSFVIDGVTYYGQLPNMRELFEMKLNRSELDRMDTSYDYNQGLDQSYNVWSSTQRNAVNAWYFSQYGGIEGQTKTSEADIQVIPVLEIPLTNE